MNRKVLLIEPNYSNKYPPMGLMKLATYYREKEDDVRYFKGNLKDLAACLLCEEYVAELNDPKFTKHILKFTEHIKTGKLAPIKAIPNFDESQERKELVKYRNRYKSGLYTMFDIVCITTLFTFYWKETIDTINFAKKFCNNPTNVMVGGIAASILPDYIFKETGIYPHQGLLNKAGDLDIDDTVIIDELPPDYSILEEIDYKYPANNSYFAYMTRGCTRNCSFCAVPRLEPQYCNYVSLKRQLETTETRFGAQKDLLLMDNNVLASNCFDKIIDEIKDCGFGKNSTYIPQSQYEIALRNLKEGFNERAYIKKIVSIYDRISEKLHEDAQADFYLQREINGCLYVSTATKDAIISFDTIARPLYDKAFKHLKRVRYVDFNQGVDARLITDENMKKLSEINIRPLRIAFDHYSMKAIYERAVCLAAKYDIKNLSNYLLYNFEDEPSDLYNRMKLNIELCEELGVTIYSFPMKYHPIDDPEYFRNRDYIGSHWNRKFIRSIQAVLNSTKGKIGRGKSFFEAAFGKDLEEFTKILWMPEPLIIYRMKYDQNLTREWWDKFCSLTPKQREKVEAIICDNKFSETDLLHKNKKVAEVLEYYKIKR